MKKTIITALVVLVIVLAFATCDSFITEPGAEKAEYTADGRKLVNLSIKTGGTAGTSRVLNKDIAQGEANWVEVIFKDSAGKFYKTEGRYNFTLTVLVPAETYGGTNENAVMLIGKKIASEYTLLAIGMPTTAVNLKTQDPEIIFDVVALNADLAVGSGSAFSYTDEKDDDITGFTDGTGSFDNFECFLVPWKKRIKASLTITGFSASKPSFDTSGLIKVQSGVNSSQFVKFALFESPNPSPEGPVYQNGSVTINSSACVYSFMFDTKDETFCVITFAIPVIGLSNTVVTTSNGDLSIWKIRGGINNSLPDLTDGTDSIQGEGVALEIAEKSTGINKKATIPPVTITE